MNSIVEYIKDIMQARGISTHQLAKKTDITQQTLYNILERGDLKLSQLIPIVRVLNIDISKLLEKEIFDEGVAHTEAIVTTSSLKKAKTEVELLRHLLEEKERVIDMQNEMISLLKAQAG